MKNFLKSIPILLVIALLLGTSAIALTANQADLFTNELCNNLEFIESYFSPEEYGGIFIDKTGNIVVNIIAGTTNKEAINSLNTRKLTDLSYNTVRYSLQEMNDTVQFLTKHMAELEISVIEPDIVNNSVNVYIKQYNRQRIDHINSFVSKSDIAANYNSTTVIDSRINDLVSIFEMKGEIVPTIDINPGEGITIGNEGVTLGFGAGGFYTAGHVSAPIGTSVKLGNVVIGKLERKSFGGSRDSAYVAITNPLYTVVNKRGNGAQIVHGVPYQRYYTAGYSVVCMGSVSGERAGIIQASGVSVQLSNGQILTGLVKATYQTRAGDSGAAIVDSRNIIHGLQSCSAFYNGSTVSTESYFITYENINFTS